MALRIFAYRLKTFLDFVFGLTICYSAILLIDFFVQSSLPLKLLALVGFLSFLFGIFKVGVGVVTFTNWVREQLVKPELDRTVSKRTYSIFNLLVWIMNTVAMIAMLVELKRIENTLGTMLLVWDGALIGLILSAISWLLILVFRRQTFKRSAGWSILFGLPFTLVLLSISGISIANGLAFVSEQEREAVVVRKAVPAHFIHESANFVFVSIDGRTERLRVPLEAWNGLQPGKKTKLTVRSGYFMYDVVMQLTLADGSTVAFKQSNFLYE